MSVTNDGTRRDNPGNEHDLWNLNTEKSSSSMGSTDSSRRFIQISPESIVLIADSAGYSQISDVVTKSLAEDTSYRLRELIQGCVQILRHSKRQKLGCDDVGLALHWSDIPPLHGQHPNLTEFEFVKDLSIHTPIDRSVDLTLKYSADSEVEVCSLPNLGVQFLSPDSEDRLKTDVYAKYFEKMSQSLMSTSSSVVKVALANLQGNSRLQPLLPTFVLFLQSLADHQENAHITKRIPMIFKALIFNPHLNVEPQIENLLQLLQDFILKGDELAFGEGSFLFVSGISQILYQLSLEHPVDQVVRNLSNIVSDANQNLVAQCKSILALKALNAEYLDACSWDQWDTFSTKLNEVLERGEDALFMQETLMSALVDVLRIRMRRLERHLSMPSAPAVSDRHYVHEWREGWNMYRVASEMMGSTILRLTQLAPSICRQTQRLRSITGGFRCNELYWTIKSKHRPSPSTKWQFVSEKNRKKQQASSSRSTMIQHVFECPLTKGRSNITIRVRNWRQRSPALLKRKQPVQHQADKTASLFASLSKARLKPVSKCFKANSVQSCCHPCEIIL